MSVLNHSWQQTAVVLLFISWNLKHVTLQFTAGWKTPAMTSSLGCGQRSIIPESFQPTGSFQSDSVSIYLSNDLTRGISNTCLLVYFRLQPVRCCSSWARPLPGFDPLTRPLCYHVPQLQVSQQYTVLSSQRWRAWDPNFVRWGANTKLRNDCLHNLELKWSENSAP